MPEIPATSLPLRFQKQFENARTAVARDNPDYAITICREILTQYPGCLVVRRLLRATQMKVFRGKNRLVTRAAGALAAATAVAQAKIALRGEPGRILDRAEGALSIDPSNVVALRLLAQAAMVLQLGETAVFALDTVIECAGESRADLVRLADAQIVAGRSPEALAIAERLLRDHPRDADVLELVKRASVEQSIAAGRWDSGSGSYRDKLRDEKRSVSLEQASKMVTSDEMATRLINEAIALLESEPDNMNHYRTIVAGCQSLGRLDDAVHWLERARTRPIGSADPTLEKLEAELRIARVQQQLDERVKAVAVACGRVQDDLEVARLRAELSRMRIAALQALVDKYPNELGQRFELGRLYQQTGDVDLAIQHFQAAQRNPAFRAQSLAALGTCFMAKSLHDLAAQQLRAAKSEINGVGEARLEVIYQLGVCLEAMGRHDESIEEFKAVYSVDIGFRDVAERVMRGRAQQSDWTAR